ncbi:MAG: T9SS type A sorting domain-containing protein [Bacteroidetes bacterium]|nr:T9SS type A sorting domain-containing protein [Bacteroidota bacterium]
MGNPSLLPTIYIMKYVSAILFLLLPFFLQAQGGLFIGSGINMVASGQPHIIVENGKFSNDGDFSADASTVHITGTAATGYSTIGGTSVTIFNDLEINKSSNDTWLVYDIEIDGDLTMKGGNLILNYSDINLGGSINGETASTRITGTDGGAIIKTVNLNMPIAENPGNIGVEITSTENLGSTTIQRRHVQLTNNGNHSIYRHFDISPANNSDLDATLRIHYFDEELAELTETDLKIWQSDGVNWATQNLNSVNPTANWVEASGFSFLHTLTLAEEMNAPLPIELTNFDVRLNQKNEVDIFWTTATEINNDYFIVERSLDGKFFKEIAIVDGAGNSSTEINYRALDAQPNFGINYYRLKQVDFNGTLTYSDIRAVNLVTDERFTVFPNPMNDVLNIGAAGLSGDGELGVEIHDELGRLVYEGSRPIEGTNQSFTINEVSKLASGSYFLTLTLSNESYSFGLVKK